MSKCPKCKKSPLNGTELICDNDCGTMFCEFCQFDWHVNQNGRLTTGHAPWCGESDSEYVDSSDSDSHTSENDSGDIESNTNIQNDVESVDSDEVDSDESDSDESALEKRRDKMYDSESE